MTELIAFGFFIVFAVACLVIWPIMLHPTLPLLKKWRLSAVAFMVLVPLGIALYAWLGVPEMARYS